ncbi:MAG: type II toxin-antitoxin system MqsA family antitoxin [Acidobacteria bacterium]|nr:type II toxin-antitoxin system MqsA family antitoxin [Acidobacteriota bacterium]MCA1642236.1 type II toxin-antitoxin system MqsA family antitoxin [Acidobacteriota bacterium]
MGSRAKTYDYGNCHVCGERMEPRQIKQDFWIKDKLVVIEDVPAGVCPQCGERVVNAETGRRIAALIGSLKQPRRKRTLSVPVFSLLKEVA